MMVKRILRFSSMAFMVLLACCSGEDDDPYLLDSPSAQNTKLEGTISFISSVRAPDGSLNIGRTVTDGVTSETFLLTDGPNNDYKPVISPDGSKIAFFRAYDEGNNFFLWNTAICVMNIDGSNFRELTDHQFMNTEPYWQRDGSNRIIWNRMIHSTEGAYGTYVFETTLDAQKGEEKQISTDQWNWSNSSLKDGRIFVLKNNAYHLMTSNSSGSQYEEINYPDVHHYLHKATISNDETMIAYMKKIDANGDDYYGSQIIYADFDASIPMITNEVVFVPKDRSKFSWYVSISADKQYIIYAEDGKILLYDVAQKTTSQVTTKPKLEYRYPTFVGTSK